MHTSSSSCSWRVRHISLFLDPQDEVGPSISSSVVLCFFVLLVYIVVLVLVVCLCPYSVHFVATFPGTVLFPLLCSVLRFFCLIHWFFSLSGFVTPSECLKNFIYVSLYEKLKFIYCPELGNTNYVQITITCFNTILPVETLINF